jgi:hypothetical protein
MFHYFWRIPLDEFGYEHAMYYGTPQKFMEVFVGRQ